MGGEEFTLAQVFRDAKKHKKVAGIIRDHLQDFVDIRHQALDGLDLSASRKIIDLGCGFGFFTEALKDRVHSDAVITGIDRFPEYEWFYFQSSDRAGLKADFQSNGISYIEKLEDKSYDLKLCSYAMYFFPDAIHHIARILKDDGYFVAITHSIPQMPEFTKYIRSILKRKGLIVTIDLPYETLISRFSDQNGQELLNPFFSKINMSKYKGRLKFGRKDHEALISYFDFKHHFFIPEIIDPEDELHREVIKSIRNDLKDKEEMVITKNDVIFICSKPSDLS